jgi:glutamate-5-semialdehyde dehydrogenase
MSSILAQFQRTRAAASSLAIATGESRNAVLGTLAELILANSEAILRENQQDLDQIASDHPMRDRLLLTTDRLNALAESVLSVRQLPDPSGQILSKKTLPNGLELSLIHI